MKEHLCPLEDWGNGYGLVETTFFGGAGIKIQRLKGYQVKKLLYFNEISSKCDTHDHKQRDIYFLLWWNSVKLNRCSGKQTLNTCRFSVFIANSSKDTVSCLLFFVLLTSFLGLILFLSASKFFLSTFPPDLYLPVRLGTFCDPRTEKRTPGHHILNYLISSLSLRTYFLS